MKKNDCDVVEVVGCMLMWVVLNTTGVCIAGMWLYVLWNYRQFRAYSIEEVTDLISYGMVVWVITVLITFSRELWIYVSCRAEDRNDYTCSLITKSIQAWNTLFAGLIFPLVIISCIVKGLHWWFMRLEEKRMMRRARYPGLK